MRDPDDNGWKARAQGAFAVRDDARERAERLSAELEIAETELLNARAALGLAVLVMTPEQGEEWSRQMKAMRVESDGKGPVKPRPKGGKR